MADTWSVGSDFGGESDDSYNYGSKHVEPIYDAFICALTKSIMRDPVMLENGLTFEREAIENWFKECREKGRNPVCPLTSKELNSIELNPSIALWNTIEEWYARKEAVQLDIAKRSLYIENSEEELLNTLKYIHVFCRRKGLNKCVIRNNDLIPNLVDMLKSSSMKVRCRVLQTLQIVTEGNDENKEVLAEGNNVRTVVKFLAHEDSMERQQAVSLLYELSKSENLCERIGMVNGAILLLVGLSSSKVDKESTVQQAEMILENLEKFRGNVRQMAENGRHQPLVKLLLEGSRETQIAVATDLSELAVTNESKEFVANKVGVALIELMQSGNPEAREASLKALNQVSSYEASAKILIEAGIIPPLVKDLFSVGYQKQKEISATLLANIVNSGFNFDPIPLGPDGQTLVSEDIVHNLLHLISNTGPAIESKLLQVLVGLTRSSATVQNVVSAIRSSGATISLVQFIEAPQRELRIPALKLLHHLSSYMGQDLAESLRATPGQLGSLLRVITLDNNGITEEHTAAIGLLAGLPSEDANLTKRLLDEGTFEHAISELIRIQQDQIRGARFIKACMEGLVRILARVTYVLPGEPDAVRFAQNHNLKDVFVHLLQPDGSIEVLRASASALKNLSLESKRLSRQPEVTIPGGCALLCSCLQKPPSMTVCRLHHGLCSSKESFCLLEGNCISKLVSCLDHANEIVVEASLEALCTLIGDTVDIEQGVFVLCNADALRPILDILQEHRTEALRQHAVWAVERILRFEVIAHDVSENQNASSALVDAFKNGDFRTRQTAERALKHIYRLPNFSSVFPPR